jgi:hypothetical protein
MFARFKSRIKKRHIAGIVVIGGLFTFQNCSQPLTSSFNDMMLTAQSGLPFAYKTRMDTIGYMSCSLLGSSYDDSAFFTFRAGAYRTDGTSGIGLTDTFIAATQAYTFETRQAAFANSDQNSGAMPQLAIRQLGSYQNVLSGNGTAVNIGQDIGPMLGSLDQTPFNSTLAGLTNGSYVNSFPGSSSQLLYGPLVASSLNFSQSETLMSSVRSSLSNGKSLLALTFTTTADPSSSEARGPDGPITSPVYGTGYKIRFQNPSGWVTSDARVLASVQETDLGGNTSGALSAWTCSPSSQFLIIRAEDVSPAGTIYCPPIPDPTSFSDSSEQAIHDAVRQILPVEDWWLNMQYRCISPKSTIASTSCYGPVGAAPPAGTTTTTPAIDYSSGACTPFTNNVLGTCPHWLSVCTRNQ